MLLVRRFDARLLRAHRQGKISFYMQSLGEEAIACAQQRALEPGDMHFPTYRQQGLLIAGGYPIVDMMNQVLSNELDPLKGRQLPVLYSSKEYGFFSISGNLATQYIQAVGWAMASALRGDTRSRRRGSARAHRPSPTSTPHWCSPRPTRRRSILNIVNNQWAISTPRTSHGRASARSPTAATASASRRCGSTATTTWRPTQRRDGRPSGPAPTSARRSSSGSRCAVGAHSTSDDPSVYRPHDEAASFPLGDPIDRLRRHLVAIGAWDDDRHDRARAADVERQVDEAVRRGRLARVGEDRGGRATRATMFDDVYAELPRHLVEQRRQSSNSSS